MNTKESIAHLVDMELAKVSDPRLLARVRELRVVPYSVDRTWEFEPVGMTCTCWTVLEHRESNTGIAYCDEGFPGRPWGLVSLGGPHAGMGDDSGWFESFRDAVRDLVSWDEA